jgi:hypothetical protein
MLTPTLSKECNIHALEAEEEGAPLEQHALATARALPRRRSTSPHRIFATQPHIAFDRILFDESHHCSAQHLYRAERAAGAHLIRCSHYHPSSLPRTFLPSINDMCHINRIHLFSTYFIIRPSCALDPRRMHSAHRVRHHPRSDVLKTMVCLVSLYAIAIVFLTSMQNERKCKSGVPSLELRASFIVIRREVDRRRGGLRGRGDVNDGAVDARLDEGCEGDSDSRGRRLLRDEWCRCTERRCWP